MVLGLLHKMLVLTPRGGRWGYIMDDRFSTLLLIYDTRPLLAMGAATQHAAVVAISAVGLGFVIV